MNMRKLHIKNLRPVVRDDDLRRLEQERTVDVLNM